MLRMSLILTLLLFVFSCKSKKDKVAEQTEQEIAANKLEMVASDLYGGGDKEVFKVIRTPGELKKFYSKVNMTRKPGLPVPDIDFSKNAVVLYCSGITHSADIPEFYLSDQTDSLLVLRKAPYQQGEDPSEARAKVEPFVLYLLPFTEKKVTLERQ